MESLVKLNTRPSRGGRKFTYVLHYTENGKRKFESLGHSNLQKAERRCAQKEKELSMGYVAPGSMRLRDFMNDSFAKTGDQIRESTQIDGISTKGHKAGVVCRDEKISNTSLCPSSKTGNTRFAAHILVFWGYTTLYKHSIFLV